MCNGSMVRAATVQLLGRGWVPNSTLPVSTKYGPRKHRRAAVRAAGLEGLLDDYDRDDTFEDYLTETIQREAYQYDLLTISTERHDHKRGTCEVAANVKVRVSDLLDLGNDASSFVAGFDIIVQTKDGLLTLHS